MTDCRAAARNRSRLALLCARRDRPSDRTADQRDELAPPNHSITSSARASNGDILRVGLCGLEIISFISSFRRSHH